MTKKYLLAAIFLLALTAIGTLLNPKKIVRAYLDTGDIGWLDVKTQNCNNSSGSISPALTLNGATVTQDSNNVFVITTSDPNTLIGVNIWGYVRYCREAYAGEKLQAVQIAIKSILNASSASIAPQSPPAGWPWLRMSGKCISPSFIYDPPTNPAGFDNNYLYYLTVNDLLGGGYKFPTAGNYTTNLPLTLSYTWDPSTTGGDYPPPSNTGYVRYNTSTNCATSSSGRYASGLNSNGNSFSRYFRIVNPAVAPAPDPAPDPGTPPPSGSSSIDHDCTDVWGVWAGNANVRVDIFFTAQSGASYGTVSATTDGSGNFRQSLSNEAKIGSEAFYAQITGTGITSATKGPCGSGGGGGGGGGGNVGQFSVTVNCNSISGYAPTVMTLALNWPVDSNSEIATYTVGPGNFTQSTPAAISSSQYRGTAGIWYPRLDGSGSWDLYNPTFPLGPCYATSLSGPYWNCPNTWVKVDGDYEYLKLRTNTGDVIDFNLNSRVWDGFKYVNTLTVPSTYKTQTIVMTVSYGYWTPRVYSGDPPVGVSTLIESSFSPFTWTPCDTSRNPVGFADYCKLSGTTTQIFGWAYDPDGLANDSYPTVNMTVGSSTTNNIPTNVANYRTADINVFLDGNGYAGMTRGYTYGFVASFNLSSSGTYGISGSVNNYPSGTAASLGINSTVSGIVPAGYYLFANNQIPKDCLPPPTNLPYGYADYCKLSNNTTLIYGWAYDPDAPADDGNPTVNLTVGGTTTSNIPTDQAGYRTADINGWLNGVYPNAVRGNTYGFVAALNLVNSVNGVGISGTINNYPNGSAASLGINSTVSGIVPAGYYLFANNQIPSACLPPIVYNYPCGAPYVLWPGQDTPEIGFWVQNTSNRNWDTTAYKLGSWVPQDSWQFLYGARVEIANSLPIYNTTNSPYYNNYAYFKFKILGQPAPGDYTFQARIVEEGQEWIGPSYSFCLKVLSPSASCSVVSYNLKNQSGTYYVDSSSAFTQVTVNVTNTTSAISGLTTGNWVSPTPTIRPTNATMSSTSLIGLNSGYTFTYPANVSTSGAAGSTQTATFLLYYNSYLMGSCSFSYRIAAPPPPPRKIAVQVYDNDVWAGSSFDCSAPASAVKIDTYTYVDPLTKLNKGSGTTNAAIATGAITFLTRIQNVATATNALTFGNTTAAGGSYQSTKRCMKDYYTTLSGVAANKTAPYTGGVDNNLNTSLENLKSKGGVYTVTGPVTLNAFTLGAEPLTLVVTGDVTISDNIIYPSSYAPTSPPFFMLVVKGNIYINPKVNKLYGSYIAQPASTNTGTIDTCYMGALLDYSNCGLREYEIDPTNVNAPGSRLFVHGSFAANKIKWHRSYGDVDSDPGSTTAGTSKAAEVIEPNWESNLLTDPFNPRAGTASSLPIIRSYETLPPVF